jgi:hypothetical protein
MARGKKMMSARRIMSMDKFLMDHLDRIEEMEAIMMEHDQVNIPVEHLFVNGMYARTIVIPADTILTGRVHKFGYVDIMLQGDITVATPEGVKRFTGYNVFEGVAGRKRAGYAHKDTYWVTVHRTDVTEPVGIEDHLTTMTVAEFKALKPGERAMIDEDLTNSIPRLALDISNAHR